MRQPGRAIQFVELTAGLAVVALAPLALAVFSVFDSDFESDFESVFESDFESLAESEPVTGLAEE
jgi:hypothetical protein